MKALSVLLLVSLCAGLVLLVGCCPLCRTTRLVPTIGPAVRIDTPAVVPTIIALLTATPPPAVKTAVSQAATAAPTVISGAQTEVPKLLGSLAPAESVTVRQALADRRVEVQRSNGERWILTYGASCTKVADYVGKTIEVRSPLIFGIPGSRLSLPGTNESCEITRAEKQ